jgi:signal transduction histidine kinase
MRQPHTVQFYADEARFRDAVGAYVRDGLAAGEPALVIARTQRRHALSRYLRAHGVGLERARERGQLTLFDAHEMLESLVRGGVPDTARFAETAAGLLQASRSRAGRSGVVRCYGEMVDVLWQDGQRDAALELETLWDEVGVTWSLRILCGYGMRGFAQASDRPAFDEICRVHTHVVPPDPFTADVTDAARQRELASLQQRALALESEVRRRQALEASLRQSLEAHRATEQQLLEQQRRLEDADRRKDAFLALVAHELRNPLAPIMTALELMRMRLAGSDALDHPLDVLERQARHLVRLLDDLLDISRITSGRIRLETEVLDAATIVHRAVELSRPLIDARRHRLSVSLPERSLWLRADPARLAQVLAHLLDNAARFTNAGGQIALSLEGGDDEVVLRVRDHGIGIPGDLLPRLFDLFAQGERPPNRPRGGLGLGLTIVRSLVALHGGRVAAHSDGPGCGSEFVVRLPSTTRLTPGG